MKPSPSGPETMTALVGAVRLRQVYGGEADCRGIWDVTSGSITLGGHELKDIPLSEIADQISYVSQDNYLFKPQYPGEYPHGKTPVPRTPEVEQAAKQSGCDAFIRKLDNGYDTVVGSGRFPIFPAVNASGLPSPRAMLKKCAGCHFGRGNCLYRPRE